jgi:hypothetical protein
MCVEILYIVHVYGYNTIFQLFIMCLICYQCVLLPSQLSPRTKLELYCSEDFSKYNPIIEEFFSKLVFDAVDDLSKVP